MWRVSLGKSLRKDRDPVNHIILTHNLEQKLWDWIKQYPSHHNMSQRCRSALCLRLKAVRFTPLDLAQAVAEHFIIIIFIRIRGKEGQLSARKIGTVSTSPPLSLKCRLPQPEVMMQENSLEKGAVYLHGEKNTGHVMSHCS